MITLEIRSKTKEWKELSYFEQSLYSKFWSNGCGWKWIIIKPPYNIFFKASCHPHDYNYTRGWNLKAKNIADKGLLKYMKQDINDSDLKCPKKGLLLIWAYLYFLAVSIFWFVFFSFGKKKNIVITIKKKEYMDFISKSMWRIW